MSARYFDNVTPRHFGPQDRIGLPTPGGGVIYYRCYEPCDDGHIFERLDEPSVKEKFTHADINQFEGVSGYSYEANWADGDRVRARAIAGVDRFADLPEDEQAPILWQVDWVEKFEERRRVGLATLSDASIAAAIKEIQSEIEAEARDRAQRVGAAIATRRPPSARTLRRWRKQLMAGGGDPLALRPHYRSCGSQTPTIPEEVEVVLAKHVKRYAAENQPLKTALYKDFCVEMAQINADRTADGEPEYEVPCEKLFRERIRRLGAFETMAGRRGRDAAEKHFRAVTTGVDVTRIGERVEIDCWKIPLLMLLIHSGVWALLSPGDRKRVKRVRWWLCVAIDAASRCILGMRMGPTASPQLALATLKMIFENKDKYTKAAGAESTWNLVCGIETLVADQGSEFVCARFDRALASLDVTSANPPAGLAEMRGRIERFFGTMHTGLISRFTGRAFENVMAKGDYPAVGRASVPLDKVAAAQIRFVVDQYHNSPHRGLKGETPFDAWNRLLSKYGSRGAPGKDLLRHVFGLEMQATLGKLGVEVLSLHYQSEALQAYRRDAGDIAVAVRVDPDDLGCASVRVKDGAWLTVPCAEDGYEGVTLAVWQAARADLRRRHAAGEKLAAPTVLKAVRDIQAIADDAANTASITTILSARELAQSERNLAITFRSASGADGEDRTLASVVDAPPKPSTEVATPPSTPDAWSIEER